jgi:CHAT domain-containing protein/tetratricopeptide (TPR) repeat protein
VYISLGKHFALSAVWLALGWASPTGAASPCDISGDSLTYTSRVNVAGRDRVRVIAAVPRFAEIVATAVASGIDIHLELVDRDGVARQMADTPIRRWGPQHIAINVGDHSNLTLDIVGKEHSGAHGTVRLEILNLSALHDARACIDGYGLMSMGDGHYAKAELISTGAKGMVGDAHEEYAEAAKAYQDAATALAPAGPSILLAKAYLSEAATFYQGLQHWTEAKQAALQAGEAFTAVNNGYGVARARAMQAAAEMEMALAARPSNRGTGDRVNMLESARKTFAEVALRHRQRHESFDEALALNNIGLAYYYEGDYQNAIGAYRHAELIYARLGEKPRDAQARQNMALVEFELGRFSAAKHDFVQVLSLISHTDNPKLYAEILNNKALAEYESGDLDAALQDYSAALTILTTIQATREQARSLQGIGAVYYTVGDREQAIDYFRRSLALRSEALDPRGRGASLRSLANVLSDLNRPLESLPLREQALALATAPSSRVRIETQIAGDLKTLGKYDDARVAVDRALTEAQDDRHAKALALIERAALEYEGRFYLQAQVDASSAINTLENSETPAEAFAALLLAARIAHVRQKDQSAGILINRALNLAEEIRTETANPELRAGLWQPIRPAFDFKIDLLAESRRGNDVAPGSADDPIALATLTVAEQSRARSLGDHQRVPRAAPYATDAGSERLIALYREIADRRVELEARLDRSAESDPRVGAIRSDISALRRDIDTLSSSAATRGSGANRATKPGGPSIQAAIETIPAHVTVIEYWLGKENAWAWVITRGKVRMISLGPSEPVERAARDLHASLSHISTVQAEKRERLAADLYTLVIAPLPADVLGSPFLVVVPDGALHYIPFAVLAKQSNSQLRYLIEDHVVATAPSLAAVTKSVNSKSRFQASQVLIVSDPVYSSADERARTGSSPLIAKATADPTQSLRLRSATTEGHFDRLPGTAREAQAISALFSPAEIDSLSGFEASRETFLSRDLTRYRIIHIAAHAISDVEAPRLSTVVLSTVDSTGQAIIGSVFSGELFLKKVDAEVFVLSACDTALGREVAGEGLLGLRYAALAAGAKSVVASMWQVPDRPAADLMAAFYTRLVRDHDPPANALAEAMRDARQRFRDPALWGAFDISITGRESLTSSNTKR